jgi:hypothetical protein
MINGTPGGKISSGGKQKKAAPLLKGNATTPAKSVVLENSDQLEDLEDDEELGPGGEPKSGGNKKSKPSIQVNVNPIPVLYEVKDLNIKNLKKLQHWGNQHKMAGHNFNRYEGLQGSLDDAYIKILLMPLVRH